METQELRIGNFINYLLFPNIPDSGILIIVSRISESHVTFIENGEENTYHINNFAPIPLSNEWLLKLGFCQDGDEYSKDNLIIRPNNSNLIIEGFEYDHNGFMLSTDYFYVHDLQNLFFAIKRSELTLKTL